MSAMKSDTFECHLVCSRARKDWRAFGPCSVDASTASRTHGYPTKVSFGVGGNEEINRNECMNEWMKLKRKGRRKK